MASKKDSNPAYDRVPSRPKADEELPIDYGELLEDLKARIRTAQVRAALSVNRELIELYWHVGRTIVERQRAEGWGKAVVERLAGDLGREFPGIKGFSAANIWRMRAFYLAWAEEFLAQSARETGKKAKLAQAARELDGPNPPEPVSDIPWFHNVVLVEKLKNPAVRLWYAEQTVLNGWSRAMLIHWIESDLYSRKGKAVTNFSTVLAAPLSGLAAEIIRDPYNFDFLMLRTDASERDLELGLLEHIQRFLLELGTGFAFVGRQVHLEVGGEDFYLDLLFYHLRLRCFIVIDLKTGDFKPEYAGKMNFYLSAVDDLMRHPDDKPSIGVILCKTRNRIIAEYALRGLAKPVGIARYITRLVESLPDEYMNELPTIEQIEADHPSPKRSAELKSQGENDAPKGGE